MVEWISVDEKLPEVEIIYDDECIDPISKKPMPTLYKSVKVFAAGPDGDIVVTRLEWLEGQHSLDWFTCWLPLDTLPAPPNP